MSDRSPAPSDGDALLRAGHGGLPVTNADLVAALSRLRQAALDLEAAYGEHLALVPAADRPSARNLLHYVAVRQHDLRRLQTELAERGLSSLGRAEAHMLASIDAVLNRLGAAPSPEEGAPDFHTGHELAARHAVEVLGPLPGSDRVRLMVTLPTAAASDAALVSDLVDAGMDIARMNCAHDDPVVWKAMVALVRGQAAARQRTVLIAFDLAGPKLRTGALIAGPRVVKVKPDRDLDGQFCAARFSP